MYEDLVGHLWQLHDVAVESSGLRRRKAKLEAAIRPVPWFRGAKARADNTRTEAEIEAVGAALEVARQRYEALGGSRFFPADEAVPAVFRYAISAIECGRAQTASQAIEVGLDEHHAREEEAMVRRVARHQRASDDQVAQTMAFGYAMQGNSTLWLALNHRRKS